MEQCGERTAHVPCAEGADDGEQKSNDADLDDAPTAGLRGLQLLGAKVKRRMDLRLKAGVCREGKTMEADDGASTVACVLLARGTREEVLAERLLLLRLSFAHERFVDDLAHVVMKISLHARLPPFALAGLRGRGRCVKKRW